MIWELVWEHVWYCCCTCASRSGNYDDDSDSTPSLLPYSRTNTSEIGRGSFAIVYRGALSDGRAVALKTPRPEKKDAASLIEYELAALKRVQPHAHIINQITISNQPVTTELLVFELADQDMITRVRESPTSRLTETEAHSYFTQMLAAILHCHHCGVAHRDIKLENWLLVRGLVKLADFGLSAIVDSTTPPLVTGVFGSPSYMSPEVLHGRTHAYNAFFADAWGVAVCLFAMVLGFFPYRTADRIDNRFSRHYNKCNCLTTSLCNLYRVQLDLCMELRGLLHNTLGVTIDRRLSVDDMDAHPWVQNFSASGGARMEEPVATNEIKKITDRRNMWMSFLTLPTLKRSQAIVEDYAEDKAPTGEEDHPPQGKHQPTHQNRTASTGHKHIHKARRARARL